MLARRDAPGETRPGGLRRSRAGDRSDPAELRGLPGSRSGCRSTWCPSAFVVLAALPLTANGKVDRAGAAGAGAGRIAADGGLCRRRPIRSRSCWPGSGPRCWGCERVGVHDDFFALGGHSLLATQVVVAGARGPRRGAAAAGAVRGSRPSRSWRRVVRRAGRPARLRRLRRRVAARDPRDRICRSPSPSSGSGSSTSSSRAIRPTTSRSAVRLRGRAVGGPAGADLRRGGAPARGAAHHVRLARTAGRCR